jgi:hypothetical protein
VRPPGFFFISWIHKFTSRAHSRVYTKPCRTDPKVLPSWSLRPWHSSFYRDNAAWGSWLYREPYLAGSIHKIFGLFSSTSRKSIPMWVNCWFYHQVFLLLQRNSIFHSYGEADISIFIGCTTSAPNESSPRGYSQIFSRIGSEVLSSFIMTCIKQLGISFPLFIFHRVCDKRSQWE